MKKYIKPETKVVIIKLENSLLAGSIQMPIDEKNPATGPGQSKGNNFFDDEDDDE